MRETGRLPVLAAFFQELRRLGYVEGENLVIERYSTEGRVESWPERVRQAVLSNPDVIFAVSNRPVQQLKAATSMIPIVGFTADPVAAGLVTSLARPGGNLTGVALDAGVAIWDKRLQLLREALPKLSRVGLLVPRSTWDIYADVRRDIAQRGGVTLLGPPLEEPINEAEYRRVFNQMAQQGVEALMVNEAPENLLNLRLILDWATGARLPTVHPVREHVVAGVLMAYGPDLVDGFRNAARQVDRILRGAKPGDVPFYQSTKFVLTLNLKTAKALGIEIPAALLAEADEVIE
jgi:putative ABC transport system substrate-binding protein